jgi:hypothetical protein
MKLRRQTESSELCGERIRVSSYSVECAREREAGPPRTVCVEQSGRLSVIRLECPYTLLSGFNEVILVRVPPEEVTCVAVPRDSLT